LRLEQVSGALTFHLANREAVDRYLALQREDYQEKRRTARNGDPMFQEKLAAARHDASTRP